MKVVLQNDLLNNEHPQAEDFITELRHSFPSVNFCPANTEADQIREIVDAEVHFGEISPAVFQAANKLRWCHFIGAGFDRLVRTNPSFVASDVILTNAPGTHAIAMADHVMAMILAFAHQLTDIAWRRAGPYAPLHHKQSCHHADDTCLKLPQLL